MLELGEYLRPRDGAHELGAAPGRARCVPWRDAPPRVVV